MRNPKSNAAAGLGAAAFALAAAGSAFAQAGPAGLWKSIDDETKTAKALIRIVEQDGALVGRIERLLTGKTDAVCEKCTDDRKGQPVQGMVILQGLRQSGDEWSGGEILDPASGKIYKAQVRPIDGGARLDVRGYVGIPAFGRTQTWLREK